MIAVALVWSEVIAAVEADTDERAGWIAATAPHVRAVELDARGGWTDASLVALAAAEAAPIALFHSHPDGRAALSATDRAAWAPTGTPLWPWPQLVVATRAGRAVAASLYTWCAEDAGPRQLARVDRGADGAWRARP